MPVLRQSGAAAFGLQRSAQVCLGDFERRDRGERQAREQRGQQREAGHAPVERDVAAAWKVGGTQVREHSGSGHRDRQAHDATPGGRDQALRDELADDAKAPCAEGGADRDLSAPRRAPRQHQCREIGARDEEQRAGGRKQQEERRSSASDDVLVQGRDGHRPAGVGIGVALLERARQSLNLVRRGRGGDARFQTGDDRQRPVAALRHRIRLEHERHPHVGGGQPKSCPDDADDQYRACRRDAGTCRRRRGRRRSAAARTPR